MKRKYILVLMQFLTSICISSVGFASWTIVSGASLEATGNIVAENVLSSDEYIYLNDQTSLQYYKTGFVSNNTVVDTGTMNVKYNIKMGNCSTLYPNDEFSSLQVILYLDWNINCEDENCSLNCDEFNLTNFIDVSYVVTDASGNVLTPIDGNSTDGGYTDNMKGYRINFKLANILDPDNTNYTFDQNNEYTLNITYSFKIKNFDKDPDVFETEVYPYMSKLSFNTTASLNGE